MEQAGTSEKGLNGFDWVLLNMPLHRSLPAFRRFALLIATAQVVAYAAAPVLEASTERAPGPHHVESATGRTCDPVHQPAACLACHLLDVTAREVQGTRAAAPVEAQCRPADVELSGVAPRAPPLTYLTRAPPTILA